MASFNEREILRVGALNRDICFGRMLTSGMVSTDSAENTKKAVTMDIDYEK